MDLPKSEESEGQACRNIILKTQKGCNSTSEKGRIRCRRDTVSITEPSEFFTLTEFWGGSSVSSSQPITCVQKRTHRVFCRPHRACTKNSVSSLFRNSALETVFCPFPSTVFFINYNRQRGQCWRQCRRKVLPKSCDLQHSSCTRGIQNTTLSHSQTTEKSGWGTSSICSQEMRHMY